MLLLLVYDASWKQWAILQQREEHKRRAGAEFILQAGEAREVDAEPVSYTHLTLPTILRV